MNATHRLLSCDEPGHVQCFACGLHAESEEAAEGWPCLGPVTEHPAYLLADGTVETCAAHPYSDCEVSR